MKQLAIYLLIIILTSLFSCAKDTEIGDIEPMGPDYILPQGKSSADDQIVEINKKYGSYILYEYSLLDFYYDLNAAYTYTLPDPKNVADAMDLLNEIWFKFYPDEFHKKFMPYKIFLTGKLEKESYGRKVEDYALFGEHSVAIGFCSDTLQKMTPTQKAKFKLTFKNTLNRNLLYNWYIEKFISIPDAFFNVSDYTTPAEGRDQTNPNYARKRGFIAKNINGFDVEWCTSINDYETGMLDIDMDLETYLTALVCRTAAQWESDLEYPAVKEKYEILKNYFITEFNVDLTKIGETVYDK